MNKIFSIPDDVFMSVISYLPDESIETLNLYVSTLLTNKVTTVKNNNAFWKEHTEILLGKILNIDLRDWKSVYETLKEPIKKDNPFIHIKSDNPDAVIALIESGYNPSMDNNSTIKYIILSGHTKIAKYLLENYRDLIDPSTGNNIALRTAATKGYGDIIRLILQYPTVDSSVGDNITLKYALMVKDTELVKILLNDKKVSTSLNKYIIELALDTKNVNIIELILKHPDIDPSVYDNHAIIYASRTGNIEAVKILLKDPRVNIVTLYNNALTAAVTNDHINIVKLLIYDSRITNDILFSGLYNAVNYGKSKIVKLLLKDGRVDPSIHNNQLINLALLNKNTYIAKLLLEDSRVKSIFPTDWLLDLHITDSRMGVAIMHYIYSNQYTRIESAFSDTNNKTISGLYSAFLKFLIGGKISFKDALNFLIRSCEKLEKRYRSVVHHAVNSIIKYDYSIPEDFPKKWSAYYIEYFYIFRAFLKLAYQPSYTHQEILNEIKLEGANQASVSFAAKLLGAYLGFAKLNEDGLKTDVNSYQIKELYDDITKYIKYRNITIN
jgi:hypothetical protein